MIELFVEGQQVDIDEGFSTLLTLTIDDIKDFGARNTTFSKTIVLPGTKRNNALFGNIFEVSASNDYDPSLSNIAANFNPAIGAKAYIFADNMQIFKGIIRLMEIIVDDGFIEYEAAVFGELGGFVAKLGNKRLEDLDFSAYDTNYTLTNIVNSWDNTPGSGVFYPLMDYGTYSVNKHDWDIRTLRPALYAKEYMDKIFAATGYSFTSDLFDSDRFKGLIVPHNRKILTRLSTAAFEVSNSGAIYNQLANPLFFPFPVQPILGSFTASGGNSTFTYGSATALSGTLAVNITGTYSKTFVPGSITVRVYKNYGLGSQVILSTTTIGTGTTSGTLAVNVSLPGTVINNGEYLTVTVVGPLNAGNNWSINVSSASMTFTSANIIDVQINPGEAIYMNSCIPRGIYQKDFVSSVLKLHNAYVFEDYDNDKLLNIQPFIDFYLNAEAVDWSNKVDRSRPMKYKPMGELNSRYYEFKFKEDSDYYNDLYKKRYNETYGSFIYDSQFEFVNESTEVGLVFSGTPMVGYVGEDKVYSTILKQSGSGTILEENTDSNIRILQSKKITGVTSWDILNGVTTLGSYTKYGYAGHFDDPDVPANDIQFGVPKELFFALATGAINVNQFNVYWSPYMAEITDKDSKLLTCTAHLYAKDVYQLNFAKLIYIDGVLFRLNKIKDFNATNEDTCELELLKVINRIY